MTSAATSDEVAADEPTPARRVPFWLAAVVVIVAALAAMWPVVGGGFSLWDDESTIVQNPALDPPTWSSLGERWTNAHMRIYSPLTHTAWHALALVSPAPPPGTLGHLSPLPFKLASVGTHLLASVLALALLRRLVGAEWPALFGALLFAVHPLQVESVAWTSGLKDLMFGAFSIACLLAYVGGEADRRQPRGLNVGLALAAFVAAGLSKPTAMVLPAMLLAVDVWLRRPAAATAARLIPFALVAAVIAVRAHFAQLGNMMGTSHQTAVSPLLRPIVAVDTVAFYLGKLVAPIGLAFDYGRNPRFVVEAARATPWLFAIKAAIVLALTAGIALALVRRRAPLIALGAILALVPLTPVLGLTYFDYARYSVTADHYVYLPMLGVTLVFAAALASLPRGHAQTIAKFSCYAAIVALVVLSHRQATTWRDGRSVTLRTLEVNPSSYGSWANFAADELRAGRTDEAARAAERAIALEPGDAHVHFVKGFTEEALGRDASAIATVRRAIELVPFEATFHYRLAQLLGKGEQLEESLASLEAALRSDPTHRAAARDAEALRAYMRARAATRPASRPSSSPTSR